MCEPKTKSKGRTGCQLVLPLPRYCERQRETPEGAREPHGEKVTRYPKDMRYKLARRGGSACSNISRLPSHVYLLQRMSMHLVIRFESNFSLIGENSL
jgi:hypothetical protein